MKKQLIIITLLLIQVIAHAKEASPVKLFADKKISSITYSMNHPLHSWTGVSNEVNSVILTDEKKQAISQVAVSVKIASFDSKNANRDSHAMEVTEAIAYPNITFASRSIVPNGKKLSVTGTLTFHGVSKSISFEVEQKKVKGKLEVTGGFDIKMTDFKIDPPSLMGLATDDDIKITFDVFY